MRRVRDTKDQMVLRESAFGSHILGAVFALVGGYFFLTAAVATLTCDRAAESCTLERSSLWSGGAQTFRLEDIDRAAVYEYTSSEGALTYSLAIATAGDVVHFLSFSSTTGPEQHRTADQINAFLADPQAASLIARRDERGMTYLFAGIFGGIGVFVLLLFGGPATVTLDRFNRTITRTAGGRLRRSNVTLTFDDVAGVEVLEHSRREGGTYVVALRQTNGERFQLNSAYSPNLTTKRRTAEYVREFLDLPPVEEQVHPTFKEVRAQMKEATAKLDEGLREAAHDLVQEGEATRLTSGSAITRLAAHLPSRALAVLVDFGVLSVVAYALSNLGFELSASVGAWTLMAFGYYTLYEGMNGATIGKRIFAMRVVQLDGSPITWKQALVRNSVRFIDALGFYLVGGLVARSSPARQRIGDRLAGTVVVWKRAVPALQEAAENAARARA